MHVCCMRPLGKGFHSFTPSLLSGESQRRWKTSWGVGEGAQEEEEGGTKSSPREGETCTGSLRVQWWWGRGGMRRHHHHRRARAHQEVLRAGSLQFPPRVRAASSSLCRAESVCSAPRACIRLLQPPSALRRNFRFFFFVFWYSQLVLRLSSSEHEYIRYICTRPRADVAISGIARWPQVDRSLAARAGLSRRGFVMARLRRDLSKPTLPPPEIQTARSKKMMMMMMKPRQLLTITTTTRMGRESTRSLADACSAGRCG